MSYFLSSILIMINSIIIFTRRRSKFFALILLFLMWFLFWGNYMNPDYENYTRIYTDISMGAPIFNEQGSEFGFRLLIKIFTSINLNYSTFLAIISLVCLLLIHSTVRFFSDNYNIVYTLYFVFPFLFDVIQIRNFIAMSIFIYSIKYLLEDKNKNNFKYLLGIIIATTFHYASIFYIPFIFISFEEIKKRKILNWVKYFSAVFSLLILANNRMIPFLEPLTNFLFDSEKLFAWTQSRTNFGFLLYWLTHFISLALVTYIRNNLIMESCISKRISNRQIKIAEFIYMINIFCLLFLPFYFLASSFFRVYRNTLILNYILFSIYNSVTIIKNRRLIINLLIILYVLFLFIFHIYLPQYEGVIEPVMENNHIFN